MIEEERLTHRKHDAYPFLSILRANNIINRQSLIAVTVLEIPTLKNVNKESIDTSLLVASKVLRSNKYKYKSFLNQHHLSHAAIGFYNSGFEEAAVVVVDGAGAIKNGGHEVESIYKASIQITFNSYIRDSFQHKKQEEVPDNYIWYWYGICMVLNTLVSILHPLANSWVLLLMVRRS